MDPIKKYSINIKLSHLKIKFRMPMFESSYYNLSKSSSSSIEKETFIPSVIYVNYLYAN